MGTNRLVFNKKFSITAIPKNLIVPLDSYSSDKSYTLSPALCLKVSSVFVIFPFLSISAFASLSIGAFWISCSNSGVICSSSSCNTTSSILKSDAFRKFKMNFFKSPASSLSNRDLTYPESSIPGASTSFTCLAK